MEPFNNTNMVEKEFNPFLQVFAKRPELEWLYFEGEKRWNGCIGSIGCNQQLPNLFAQNVIYSCYIVAVYLLVIFGGRVLMANRPAFKMDTLMAGWNLFLAVFSFCGMVRVLPHLWITYLDEGFDYTICTPPSTWYGLSASGLWTALFIISKIPELFDTVLIVLRKKPLIFLHWYHHVTVLLYCWHSMGSRVSCGLYFAGMNFTVHSVMYFYYFCRAVHIWPRSISPIFITVMQLTQMIAGFSILVRVAYIKWQGGVCAVSKENLGYAFTMYASYAALFLHFLIMRFCIYKEKEAKKKVA